MGKNPCRLCATPGVTIDNAGHQHCWGCGTVCVRALALWLRRAKTQISFDKATRKFEQRKARGSFGEFIIARNYEMIGRP